MLNAQAVARVPGLVAQQQSIYQYSHFEIGLSDLSALFASSPEPLSNTPVPINRSLPSPALSKGQCMTTGKKPLLFCVKTGSVWSP